MRMRMTSRTGVPRSTVRSVVLMILRARIRKPSSLVSGRAVTARIVPAARKRRHAGLTMRIVARKAEREHLALGTPLVPSRSLGALLGFADLGFKLESGQPTGSWLDRDAARL